ncbi:MAG: ABC-type transport auxiliary lipoprotein family protein [Gammaproteobacteria bacterium]
MRKFLMLPLLAISLSGCSGLFTTKSQPMSEYTLAPAVSSSAATTSICNAVLRVSTVQASPPWSSNNLVYTETPYQVSSFAYHRWAAPPATMLSDALVKALAASGLYRVVLGPTDPGNGDLTLAIRILQGPVQHFSGTGAGSDMGGSSAETFAFAAALTDTGSGQLYASKEFSAETEAAPNPYSGVVAANKVTGELIDRLVKWLGSVNTGEACRSH